jgi:hypothetical protein
VHVLLFQAHTEDYKMPYLPQIKILVPSAQVSSYTTGVLSLPSAKSAFIPLMQRALFAGGINGSNTRFNNIDQIDITTGGTGVDFGDLISATNGTSACSSSTRCLWLGGNSGSDINVIQYATFATSGNATDFGDLTVARERAASLSSSTRGICAGGNIGDNSNNTIDYVTIATTGNATDFGDQTAARTTAGSCASPTRGLVAAGYINPGNSVSNIIDYITIASAGNAIDFGDCINANDNSKGGLSDATRGIFAGGGVSGFSITQIEYVTIASTGNATNFGNLSQGNSLKGTAGLTRGIFVGNRHASDAGNNIIDQLTIQTLGNATDFGELSYIVHNPSGSSSAHGGL